MKYLILSCSIKSKYEHEIFNWSSYSTILGFEIPFTILQSSKPVLSRYASSSLRVSTIANYIYIFCTSPEA